MTVSGRFLHVYWKWKLVSSDPNFYICFWVRGEGRLFSLRSSPILRFLVLQFQGKGERENLKYVYTYLLVFVYKDWCFSAFKVFLSYPCFGMCIVDWNIKLWIPDGQSGTRVSFPSILFGFPPCESSFHRCSRHICLCPQRWGFPSQSNRADPRADLHVMCLLLILDYSKYWNLPGSINKIPQWEIYWKSVYLLLHTDNYIQRRVFFNLLWIDSSCLKTESSGNRLWSKWQG